jgi:hypothetical protein
MADVLTVRAHHLGCVAHFAVHGGDHATLPILLEALRDDPCRPVRVVAGPDDICRPCPHWNGVECVRKEGMEPKNRAKDEAFLEVLGLSDGDVLAARKLFDRVAERFTLDALRRICPTCEPEKCAAAVLLPWLDAP